MQVAPDSNRVGHHGSSGNHGASSNAEPAGTVNQVTAQFTGLGINGNNGPTASTAPMGVNHYGMFEYPVHPSQLVPVAFPPHIAPQMPGSMPMPGHIFPYGNYAMPGFPNHRDSDEILPMTPGYQPQRAFGYDAYEAMNGHGPVPGLETAGRRSSYSTTESTPATPFYGSNAVQGGGDRVHVLNRSAYTTPSPQQLVSSGLAQPKHASSTPAPFDQELEALVRQEPSIPKAIPAIFTPTDNLKSLEQSLVNTIPGNRNVYIRGLHPTTDDETLLKYTERFGEVETSKAIIDTATGACKGFGFAKFVNVEDSKACIRGFFGLGYEVGFARVGDTTTPDDAASEIKDIHSQGRAGRSPSPVFFEGTLQPFDWDTYASGMVPYESSRTLPLAVKRCNCPCVFHSDKFTNFDPHDQESFNSRLKAEGDPNSTNLYISNLPKEISEAGLATIFRGYTIMSSKVLRDPNGNSRGVGFARFESREVCDKIIEDFTGLRLGEMALAMQIRYADTPAQKELKRITCERRQFRTNEYNVGAYGTALVGMTPAMYNQPGWRRGSNGFIRGPSFGQQQHLRDCKIGNGAAPASVAPGNAAASEDGSGDEGVTIHVDSPTVADGSTRSSPVKKSIKQEKD